MIRSNVFGQIRPQLIRPAAPPTTKKEDVMSILTHVKNIDPVIEKKEEPLVIKEKSKSKKPKDESKETKTKRSYMPILDSMWQDLKSQVPELKEAHRVLILSDGKDYYINQKSKKVPFEGINILKLVSK